MTLVTAVLAVVFGSIYFSARQNVEEISLQVLHRVINEDVGGVYRSGSAFSRDDVLLPYFTVSVWPDNGRYNVYVTSGTYSNLQDSEELTAILTECLTQDQQEGTIKGYNLRYLRQDNGLYQKLAFVDMSMELSTLQGIMRSYLIIGMAALLLLFAISCLLAWWATRPVEKAWRQQRQFLSDASHELKTPLTVILSNAELLEASPLEERPARWANNIQSESQRMKSLVEEMLTLARADNMPPTAVLTEVSLSDLTADCALSFEPVAFEAGKPLDYQIDEDITVLGDRDKLRQLASILLDNAIKYGADGGVISLTLQKTDRQAILTVSNPGDPIPAAQLPHLFERFYRADDSRGEKSGFGLGLSIAATIAKDHKGTIKAESDPVSTRFIFTMPIKKS
jgi:signal transduction histidine kinase